MPLEWSDDPAVFASSGWRALVDADPEASVFHSPDYLRLYWEELGGGGLRVALAGDADGPGVACAFDLTDGTLTFLGGSEVTDYMGPVGHPDDRERAAKELVAGLAATDDWVTADLRGLPRDGTWLDALAAAAREAGLACEIRMDGVAPMLDLPRTWEAYLARLPGKLRHEIRRKERRLRERFPAARLVDATPESLETDLDRFVALHRASGGAKGGFMDPRMERFFRRLGEALLDRGVLRLAFLEAPGERLAGVVAFRWRGSLLLYNSAYDRAHARVAPGMVLVSEVIRDAIAAGCRAVDMLKGDLGYKYRFGARSREVRRLVLSRR